jgi:hypothetical protein
MRRALKTTKAIIFILVMITAAKVSAQSVAEKKVALAVESLRMAMIKADTVQLKELAADGLTYGHSSGKLQNKAEFVSSFATGASVFVSIDLTDQTIKVTGSTAIVRHVLTAKTNDGGKPGAVHIGVLLVWGRIHNQWKMLARQAFKLA